MAWRGSRNLHESSDEARDRDKNEYKLGVVLT